MKRTDYLLTGFLQDNIGLVKDRLSLTLGTKLLRTNYTGFGPQPSVRLLWTPSDRQTVWAAFTHALRTPSDSEEDFYLLGYAPSLSSGNLQGFARFNPNRQFAPEQLNGTELGYRRLLGAQLYIDIASFYNHYHDLFSEDIVGAPFVESDPAPTHILLPAQFANGLQANTKGLEIAPEWRPRPFWRLRGSYSYLHMDVYRAPDKRNVESPASISGASPQHQVSVQSAFDLTKKLQLDLSYRYISELPALGVPSYSTGDVRLGWRFSPEVELSLVGQNLFQAWHEEDGFIGIRRSVYARLTWSR